MKKIYRCLLSIALPRRVVYKMLSRSILGLQMPRFVPDQSFAEPLVDHAPCGSSAKSALPLGSCSCRSSGESMCAQESSTCESIGPWERDSQYFSGQDAFCADHIHSGFLCRRNASEC